MQAITVTVLQAIASGAADKWQSPTAQPDTGAQEAWGHMRLPDPDPAVEKRLFEAHQAARGVLREKTEAAVVWTVANGALSARPGAEDKLRELNYSREDLYLAAARNDDFVGVQAYSSQEVDEKGTRPTPTTPWLVPPIVRKPSP